MVSLDEVLQEKDRTMIFIDGSNLYSTTKLLGFDTDYDKFLKLFRGKCNLIRVYYYTAVLNPLTESRLRPALDWMSYNGYHVVTKPAKEYTDDQGRTRTKGNIDVELSVGMLQAADHIDHAILVSGDGDFRSLVQAVQFKGVKVTVMSTTKASSSILSDDLRRQADSFVDLFDLKDLISRNYPTQQTSQSQVQFQEQV